MRKNILENKVAELATLILKDGDRFCGKPSQRRTSAIIEAVESIGFNIGKHTFDHSDQVESRPEITVSEVVEWVNSNKKYLVELRKQIIQHQEQEAKIEAETESEGNFINMETGEGFWWITKK